VECPELGYLRDREGDHEVHRPVAGDDEIRGKDAPPIAEDDRMRDGPGGKGAGGKERGLVGHGSLCLWTSGDVRPSSMRVGYDGRNRRTLGIECGLLCKDSVMTVVMATWFRNWQELTVKKPH
jgi:hypothetical protein